jgi:hypothetical protein
LSFELFAFGSAETSSSPLCRPPTAPNLSCSQTPSAAPALAFGRCSNGHYVLISSDQAQKGTEKRGGRAHTSYGFMRALWSLVVEAAPPLPPPDRRPGSRCLFMSWREDVKREEAMARQLFSLDAREHKNSRRCVGSRPESI